MGECLKDEGNLQQEMEEYALITALVKGLLTQAFSGNLMRYF